MPLNTAASRSQPLPISQPCRKDEQRAIVARCDAKVVLQEAAKMRALRDEARRAQRVQRLIEISSRNTALPGGRRYPIILADPPWQTKAERKPHYPVMHVSEICALPVKDLAAEAAALFLWTTSPRLQKAFEVIEAWAFEYKTTMAWVKHAIGTGYFVRNQHELLLIACRGDFPLPPPAARPSSVIMASRREHSEKPDAAYGIIERMYPELPRIELFARNRRKGWDAWGNEAPRVRTSASSARSRLSQPNSRRPTVFRHKPQLAEGHVTPPPPKGRMQPAE